MRQKKLKNELLSKTLGLMFIPGYSMIIQYRRLRKIGKI